MMKNNLKIKLNINIILKKIEMYNKSKIENT